jgi:hypothetical protein
MKRALVLACALALVAPAPASAQLDKFLKEIFPQGAAPSGAGLSDVRIAAGLKEALQVGTQNTVNLTGKVDGYLANQAIKILMPEQLRSAERTLRAVGFGEQVDRFVASMNRAAERAAPAATSIFVDAIGAMTFDDARKILSGGNTAATEYFKGKTTEKLTAAFRPTVEGAMNEVGVTRQYKEITGLAHTLPFTKVDAVDIDSYVVTKALDGLFHVLGEEEQKIRTNPTARVTELLRETFGK